MLNSNFITNALSDSISDRILVLVRLKGGNDGLNTIVPLSQYDTYVSKRPTLHIPNNKIIKLYPEIRIYNQPVIATSEAAIKTTLFKDRFITINLIKDEQLFNVRYQNKPFMIWIWISTLIIIFGGTFAVFRKK